MGSNNTEATQKRLFQRSDILTWNVEGKGSPAEIDIALQNHVKEGPFIICLQRANLPSDNGETENYKWYCSEKFGSAVLISKHFADVQNVTFVQPCQEICMADITFASEVQIKAISCYIPPPTDYQCEDVWLRLTDIIKALPVHSYCVLGGDLNAQIGRSDVDKTVDVGILGVRLHHEVSNENGKRLQKLARAGHLKVLSSYWRGAKSTWSDCYTYKNGSETSQQDHFLSLIPFLSTISCGEVWDSNYNHALHFIKLKVFRQDTQNAHVKLNLNSWNIQGATPEKVDKMVNDLNLPLLCVQEVFLTSEEDIQTENYEWHTSKKMWAKNVGILIKKTPDIVLKSFDSISDCLCSANITYLNTEFTIFCCYFNQNNPKNIEHEEKLIELVKAQPEEARCLIAGNFCCLSGEEKGKYDPSSKLRDKLELTSCLALLKSKKAFVFAENPLNIVFQDVLLSKSLKLMGVNLHLRWIPFYSNPIFFLQLNDDIKPVFKDGKKKKLIATDAKFRIEERNGTVEKIYTCEMKYDGPHIDEEDITPQALEPEIVEKFKDKPPSPQELSEILKDFVLFHGPNNASILPANKSTMLLNSFIHNRLGKLTLEEVEVMSEDKKTMIRKISRIKWNGILLMETSADPVASGPGQIKKLSFKSVTSLILNLCTYSYFVKGKMSFYHKGMKPILMKDLKVVGVIRPVIKKNFPTMPEVFKHIDETFAVDTEAELVFSTDFNRTEFKEIETYAMQKKLGCRYFKFSATQDNIAVYKRQTPQEIRDKLLKNSDDFKYQLIPPAGPGVKDYDQYCQTYEGKNFKAESRVIASYYVSKQQNMGLRKEPNSMQNNKPKAFATRQSLSQKLMQQQNPMAKGLTGQSTLKTIEKKKNINPVRQRNVAGKAYDILNRESSRPLPRESLRTGSEFKRKLSSRSSRESSGRGFAELRSQRGREAERRPLRREYLSKSQYPERENQQKPTSRRETNYPNSQRNSSGQLRDFQPPRPRLNPWDTASLDFNASMPSNSQVNPWDVKSDFLVSYPIRNDRLMQAKIQQQLSQLNSISQTLAVAGNSLLLQPKEFRDNTWTNQQQGVSKTYGINPWNDQRQDDGQTFDFVNERKTKPNHWEDNGHAESGFFDAKQPRVDTRTMTQEPHWQSLAPLIIVYPIKANSELEDSGRKILEYNFTVEFVGNNDSSWTMGILLPLRDGSYRRHNICRGQTKDAIGEQAFQLIMKHSTIIKPLQSYLCHGDIPDFIRYMIPCQNNPRNYIILNKNETGPIYEDTVDELLESFIRSANDDLFFDRETFTFPEKMIIVSVAEKKNLLVRHFGDLPRIADRYICVYRKKTSYEIYSEIGKNRGVHYKYQIITDRTPYNKSQ